MNTNSFYSYSFGCRVNEAEKEEIDRQMSLKGFIFDRKNPGIFIINTCSVTNKAEREARQLIYQTKKNLPDTKIVVTGCSATYWLKNNLYQNLPVDLIIDNVHKEFLIDLIRKILGFKPTRSHNLPYNLNSNKFIGSGRVMIKIQDGCQRYCTFCMVPYLRGIPKSQRINNLELKIKNFEGKAKEVILTAINTQAFGFDTKETFIDLIKTVIEKTTIPRISLGSVHPWSLTDDFLAFYRSFLPKNRLINFFHIPIQSGSNKMLSLMKRGYRREEILSKLNELQGLNPFALIATDIIVGFLEETDSDFEETYNFLKDSPINKFHIFRFSKRSKTQADYMAKSLIEPSAADKLKRAEVLIKLSHKKFEKFNIKNVGRVSSVLFLEKTTGKYRNGLLDNQLPILVASGSAKAGEIKNVKVIEFKKGRLFGKII